MRNSRRLFALGLLLGALVMFLAGCGSGGGSIPIEPPPAAPPDRPPSVIWLGPNLGSPDMLELFREPAAWAQTRDYISGFRFASEHIMAGGPGTEAPNWGQVGPNTYQALVDVDAFRKLRQWGIQTVLGVGAVKPGTCDAGYAGDLAENLIAKVADAGGQVNVLVIDEPLPSASLHCQLSPAQAATITAGFARRLLDAHPGLQIGLAEAYPFSSAAAILSFVDLLTTAGFAPAFLHLDVDRNAIRVSEAQVSADLASLSTALRARGTPFGQYLWGQMFTTATQYRASVLSWVDRLQTYALKPERVIVESWEVVNNTREIPANLPQGDPLAHTTLVLETAHRMQIAPQPKAPLHIGVEDARTHRRIAGATITIADQQGVTNEDGYFGVLLRRDFHTFYPMLIEAEGYEPHRASVEFGAGGDDGSELVADLDPIKPPVVKRTGVVRLEGNSLVDAQGKWFAEAVTLMPAIALVNEHAARAAKACELAELGIDAIRVLAVVGGDRFQAPGGGTADPWSRLASDPRDPQFPARLARMIDYFYDDCGFRTGLVVFGGTAYAPSAAEQSRVIQHVLSVVQVRLHKVAWIELTNERQGFQNAEGVSRGRALITQLRAALQPNFPIGFSSTNASHQNQDPRAEEREMFEGSGANLATPHFPRVTNTVDGPWRYVRQPWEFHPVYSIRGGVDNEPMGPGSSITSERDTSRLVAAWITAKVARLTARVFHTDAGVWAGLIDPAFFGGHADGLRGHFSSIQDEPGALLALQSIQKLRAILPSDMHTWNRTRHGLPGHPFGASFQQVGNTFTQIWPDGHTGHGVVRMYCSTSADRFVCLASGIRDRIDLRWSCRMEAQIYSTKTGEPLGDPIEAHERSQTLRQTVDTDQVVVGTCR